MVDGGSQENRVYCQNDRAIGNRRGQQILNIYEVMSITLNEDEFLVKF